MVAAGLAERCEIQVAYAIGVAHPLSVNVETFVHALEAVTGTRFLAADVYFITDLPAELRIPDLAKVCGTAFVLSVISTLYPAWRAARTQPAEALRYE